MLLTYQLLPLKILFSVWFFSYGTGNNGLAGVQEWILCDHHKVKKMANKNLKQEWLLAFYQQTKSERKRNGKWKEFARDCKVYPLWLQLPVSSAEFGVNGSCIKIKCSPCFQPILGTFQQGYLAECEGKRRHSASGDSIHSSDSGQQQQQQVSAPGTPQQQHNVYA